MRANLRRWWTPTEPVFPHPIHWWLQEPVSGWQFTLVPVLREMLKYIPQFARVALPKHRRVHHDFDRDLYVYAWWPIAPLARVAYWWRYGTPLRWSIERWMNRRVADKREGWCYNFALLGHWRPLRAWTWRRIRSATR
jgi:hypothetical protein